MCEVDLDLDLDLDLDPDCVTDWTGKEKEEEKGTKRRDREGF